VIDEKEYQFHNSYVNSSNNPDIRKSVSGQNAANASSMKPKLSKSLPAPSHSTPSKKYKQDPSMSHKQ
jgi:hypothetical protein